MEVMDLKNHKEYVLEVMTLEFDEWASNVGNNRGMRIARKVAQYEDFLNHPHFCKLILLDQDELVGFISIFPHDCSEEPDLEPWYATMYVKEKFRGRGYSKILNEAILEEARCRGIKTLYLKTSLEGYYEKFGQSMLRIWLMERKSFNLFYERMNLYELC